jgi:2-polyprenyl-3-methyl-5-hydroxy-6-metoxy-1,4-benzoquinol methylase
LACDTLIGRHHPEDPVDLYGADYWTTHQTEELGHPDIYRRARLDLSERALYWLKTMLHYRRPPGRTLELGCGHGGFVALLDRAGFQAFGLELNSWTADVARERFDIPVLTGDLAEQALEPGSLDAIILLDVLEHLPDPAETVKRCRTLLKPDGLLLIQTPAFPAASTYETLQELQDPFLNLLLPGEHLYLFSKQGLRRLLARIGFTQVAFEKALFPYDMFCVASAAPLHKATAEAVAATLIPSVDGQLILALLDLYDRAQELEAKHHKQHEHIGLLTEQLQEAEDDRQARLTQVEGLTADLREAETDRAARLAQIKDLTHLLQEAEDDRHARLAQVKQLTGWLETAEADRQARLAQVEELTARLREAEVDRAARLAQIKSLTQLLQEAEDDRQARLAQVEQLSGWLETAEADRQARLAQVEELTAHLLEAEADRAAHLAQISTLTGMIKALENRPETDREQADRDA